MYINIVANVKDKILNEVYFCDCCSIDNCVISKITEVVETFAKYCGVDIDNKKNLLWSNSMYSYTFFVLDSYNGTYYKL